MTDEQLAELERDVAWLVQNVAPDVSSRAEDSIWRVDGAVRALVAEVRRLRALTPPTLPAGYTTVSGASLTISAAEATEILTGVGKSVATPLYIDAPFRPALTVTHDDGFVAPPPHVTGG
jgi:hypothetical protein